MRITVVITSYRRVKDLERCLEGLKKQTRPADEIVVVARDTDTETWAFLRSYEPGSLPLHAATVIKPGAIAAANVGLNEASGDIIAYIDDDAIPHPDWLERIEPYYLEDDKVGGVGGRDFMYQNDQLVDGSRKVVGRVQWFGRVIGNHHLGIGKPREVDVLKGVNMSFRRTAIADRRFSKQMRGTSAQIHFEIEFCLALKKRGWKLIYDPKIAVDHYLGKRFDEDQRQSFNHAALVNIVHNETLALLEHLPAFKRIIFLSWSILIGTSSSPGILQWFRLMFKDAYLSKEMLLATIIGRFQGWKTWQQTRTEGNK
jgi:GT2 family glycosyltransferase